MNLAFSNDALDDLRGIARFTRKTYGKRQAKWYIGQIEHDCAALAAGRFGGRSAAIIAPGLRKHIVESHIVFFRIVDDDVVVVRVLHVSMNHADHL